MADYEELPSYYRQPRSSGRIRLKPWCLCLVFLTLAISVFFLWPRQVEIRVVNVDLKGMNVNTSSGVHLDVDLAMWIEANNLNFFSIRYDQLMLYISYRGDEIGTASSKSSALPARSSVNLTALVKVEGVTAVKHVAQLISDASRNLIPVTMTADFSGNIGILLLNPHVKGTVSCYLLVDPSNNEILQEQCRAGGSELVEHPLLLLLSKSKFSMSNWYMIALVVGVGLLVLVTVVWILWPKIPEITVQNFQVLGLSADSKFAENSYIPEVVLDINFSLELNIRNRNVVGVKYDKITVYVFYYGYEVCRGELDGSEIAARDTSTIQANLNLRGAEIVYNSAQLLSDVAKREVPMNAVIEFNGNVGIWWLKPHIKAAVGYDIKVDPVSNEILSQDVQLKGNDF